MNTKSKTVENFLFSVGGVLAMFFLLIGVYIISHLVGGRVDLTHEKLYTLSSGTRAILKKLDTPVEIRYYASQGKEMPPELKTYAQRVDDLLAEYKKAAGNKIRIKKFDPQPDSDAEEKATIDGIEGQPLQTGEKVFMGLSISMLDSNQSIPFLDPGRERLLEYDITRAIANVINPTKPVVGVMSGLPVFGEFNPMMMRMGGGRQDPWVVITELKRDFTVKEIQTSADKIDDDVKILVVIHPKGLSDKTMFALDQFVLRGGKMIAFVDPHSTAEPQPPGQNPLQAAASGGSSLDKLTKAWGLEYDMNKVVADNKFKTRVGRGGPEGEFHPAVLSLTGEAVNTNDVVTSQIDNLLMLFPGTFTGTPVDGLKETVLVHTSTESQLVEKFMATFSGEQIIKDFQASGKEYPLAIRLTGKFKTAFPEGKPKDTAPTDKDKPEAPDNTPALKESTKETSVVLVGDTDMLVDRFVAQVANFFGQKLIQPINANLSFVQSLVEQMGGDENLIQVRSRATMNRPFTRIRDMQAAAEKRFQSKIKDLEKTLQDAQTKINELQKGKEGNQKFILSPDQQAEIKRFQEKRKDVAKDLRQERKNLRREVDSLENRLKWMNIAGMPFVVTLAGISLALVKRKKTAAK